MDMKSLDPQMMAGPALQRLLQGAIAPRPIALASTIDRQGNQNLSPFSFFNLFGINPTTLIFSPSRRSRDNTVKHTYENVKEVPEVVINMVNHAMVEQVSLASTEYPRGVSEFIKAGFTPIPSETIRPMRVKESPVQLECKVRQVIETSALGGSANLVICEILRVHIDEGVLDEKGDIDPKRIDLVGRMGGDLYVRASGEALFRVAKPLERLGIGVDHLLEAIRLSEELSGNDLGRLGNMEQLPTAADMAEARQLEAYQNLMGTGMDEGSRQSGLHRLAREYLLRGEARMALSILYAYHLSS